jgi:hypothetical protein
MQHSGRLPRGRLRAGDQLLEMIATAVIRWILGAASIGRSPSGTATTRAVVGVVDLILKKALTEPDVGDDPWICAIHSTVKS